MKEIEIAVETELANVVNLLLAGENIPLTAILFHKDDYRVLTAKNASLLPITQTYLEDKSVNTYALIFEGYYEDEVLEGASECLTSVVVTRDGNARVEHIPFVIREGSVDIRDKQIALMDAPYLHLFDPIAPGKYNEKAISAAVASAKKAPKKPYCEFIVASIGL
jgi:hypothetical protein